jgi:NADPH2:quinone reductase
MQAIRQYEHGGPDKLLFEEVDDPVAAEGQAVIRVEAAGVHLVDTAIRKGEYAGPAIPANELPMTPGREAAGVVDSVGGEVDAQWIGKRVVLHLGPGGSGGYAERVAANVALLHEIPPHLDAAAAVAMIGTGRTALGILGLAELRPEDVVLVTAAAGGLGNLFVQYGRNHSATVIGLAGGREKVDLVSRLGADCSVDYRNEGWPDEVRRFLGGRDVSVVLDGVGGEAGRVSFDLLGSGGRFVIFGWSAGEATQFTTADVLGRALTVIAAGPHMIQRAGGMRALESQALAEASAGLLVPRVTRFALRKAAAAHRALETRGTTGKVVLEP